MSALSPLKFAAGFIANLTCQSARSLVNAAGCVALASYATIRILLAALQLLGGGRKVAMSSARSAWSATAASAKMGATSVIQAAAVLTLLSPLARAAQACSEGMMPKGVFAPSATGRWQRMFGMNSWDQHDQAPPVNVTPKKASAAMKPSPPPARPAKKAPKPKQEAMPKPKADPRERLWADLAEKYLRATTAREADRIAARMAVEFPAQYARALATAQTRKRRRHTAAYRPPI